MSTPDHHIGALTLLLKAFWPDALKYTVASLAVVSPWWLPTVNQFSQGAATFLPVFGCAWLLMQMVAFLIKQLGGVVFFWTAFALSWAGFIAWVISGLEPSTIRWFLF